jgi:hypothetical protein
MHFSWHLSESACCACPVPAFRQRLAWSGDQSVAHRLLARELAGAAQRLALFPRRFLGRLLVKPAPLHFPEYAFALHFLFQHPESLIDIVVADEYLQLFTSLFESTLTIAVAVERMVEAGRELNRFEIALLRHAFMLLTWTLDAILAVTFAVRHLTNHCVGTGSRILVAITAAKPHCLPTTEFVNHDRTLLEVGTYYMLVHAWPQELQAQRW